MFSEQKTPISEAVIGFSIMVYEIGLALPHTMIDDHAPAAPQDLENHWELVLHMVAAKYLNFSQ